jgi:hypothetical protein
VTPHPGTSVKMRCLDADKTTMTFGEIHAPLRVTLDDQGHRCAECFNALKQDEAFLAPEDCQRWVCSRCYVKLLPGTES